MARGFVHTTGSVNTITYRHWLPIVTFCPVNKLPDLIYISVETQVPEDLYQVRKRIRKAAAWKCMYMEEIASAVLQVMPRDAKVTLTLAFGRHVVTTKWEDK